MFNDKAWSGLVRPLLASISCGLLLGSCGSGGGESSALAPGLGQGNAADVLAEYLASRPTQSVPGNPAASRDEGARVAMDAGTETRAVEDRHAVGVGDAGAQAQPQALALSRTSLAPAQGSAPALASAQVQGGEGDMGVASQAVITKLAAIQHAGKFHGLARQVVEKVNELRARPQRCGETHYPAVGPLVWNARVAYAAWLESDWMVKRNEFSHRWEDGKYVWDRFEMANYAWTKADENIAAGFHSLDEAMQAWLESPSHCKAMMRADIREIGLAVLPGQPGNRYRSYWTMALGARD